MTSSLQSRHRLSSEQQLLRQPSGGLDDGTMEETKPLAKSNLGSNSKTTPSKHKSKGRRRTNHGHVVDCDDETENDEGDEEKEDSSADEAEADYPSDSGDDTDTLLDQKVSGEPTVPQDRVGNEETRTHSVQAEAGAHLSSHTDMTSSKKRDRGSALIDSDEEKSEQDAAALPRKRRNTDSEQSKPGLKYNRIEAAALRALAAEAKKLQDALASDDDDEVYRQLDDPGNDSDGDSLMENPEDALLADSDVDEEIALPGRAKDGSPSDQEHEDPTNELRLSAKIDDFFGNGGFLAGVDEFDADNFMPSFLSEPSNPRRKSESSERRVRFQDEVVEMASSSSSSSSSEFDVDTFPDLLDALDRDPIVAQDSLDQALLHQLEGEDDFDSFGPWDGSDGAGSEYDFGEHEAAMHIFKRAPRIASHSDDPSESDEGSLSGYDSDGDTTDDDMPTLQTISKPKTILHSPARNPQTRTIPAAFPRSRRVARRGPVMGTFQAVEDKPFAYYDSNTGRMRIISTPRRPTRLLESAGSSASNSPHIPFVGLDYESDSAIAHMSSSLFPANLDVMMSGVFGGPPGQRFHNGRFVSSHADLYGGAFGAPEAFFAQRLDSLSEEGSDYTTETNSSAAQIDVLSDFVHMEQLDAVHTTDEDGGEDAAFTGGNDSTTLSEESEQDEDPLTDSNAPHMTTPSARNGGDQIAKPTRSSGHGRNLSSSMLAHFDRGVVGSFRNNQDRYRMLSQLPNGTSDAKPLKAGKSAMDVITPPRRKRGRRSGTK